MSIYKTKPSVEKLEAFARENAIAVGFPPDRVLCRSLGLFKMLAPSCDCTFVPHLALDGYWESWTTAGLCRIVGPGMKVVEVGAHIGYYTMLLAHLVGDRGRVEAFEANRTLEGILVDNVRLNGFDRVVSVHQCVVGEHCGETVFRWPASSTMSGSVVWKDAGWMTDRVKSATLDVMLKETPDVLVMDACGSEPLIVRGAMERIAAVGRMMIVCRWKPYYAEEFGDRLFQLGFRAAALRAAGELDIPEGSLQSCDDGWLVFRKESR